METLEDAAKKGVTIIGKINKYFYDKKKANERLQEFLEKNNNLSTRFDTLESDINSIKGEMAQLKTGLENNKESIKGLTDKTEEVNERITKLEESQCHDDTSIQALIEGAKFGLLNTLHSYWREYVNENKYATLEQKHYVEEIYEVYANQLHGNNQGEKYYSEIMSLPERRETDV